MKISDWPDRIWPGLNVIDEKCRLFQKKRDVPHKNSAARKRHRDVISSKRKNSKEYGTCHMRVPLRGSDMGK